MEKLFGLKRNGTNVRTELIGGLTAFMTMAYIIALNPTLLAGSNPENSALWNGVFMATCIASAVGTICMALLANKPFVMAPGMGINNFFALVVSNIAAMTGFTYLRSFQSALVIILIEGIVFIILSMLSVREKIVEGIPLGIRLGIAPAMGLMLMNIGFGSNAGISGENGTMFYVMRDFFGSLTASAGRDRMGESYPVMVLVVVTMLVGFFVIVALDHRKIKGAVLFGILSGTAVYWAGEAVFLGVNPFVALQGASFIPPFADMAATTLFRMDFAGLMQVGWLTVITLVASFCIVDMFDTIGTLVGTAARANMLDKNGKMPGMKKALMADAIGTVSGALTGTSTVTTFVESASGVAAGGRTGLTALTAGLLFLLCIFLAPVVALIPKAATSPALIYVGILMMNNLKKISFDDPSQFIPVCVMMLAIPVSGSIGHGIGLALITYTVIQCCSGKIRQVSPLTFVLSVIFLMKFFIPV